MEEITYFVTGTGAFPIDMLRHDECWPVTEIDSRKISDLLIHKNLNIPEWQVAVRSTQQPTVDRWKSFGCSVAMQPKRQEIVL